MIADQDITQTVWVSPLGPLRLAATPLGLAGAWFDTDRHGPDPQRVQRWTEQANQPLLVSATSQLGAYFKRQRSDFDLPLDLRLGTPFQQQAWRALLTIGPGETISYAELARRMGRPQAARAAGAAIGRNPLSIIVPCHRVVGSNGSLTGYAGGLERKRALLQLEGAWI